MHCRKCGATLAVADQVCPRCSLATRRMRPANRGESESAGGRIWVALGLLFILLSIGIIAGAFWIVDKKRAILAAEPTATNSPFSVAPAAAAPALNLSAMDRDQLLKLVPVNLIAHFKSAAGDNLPDDMRAVKI